MCQFDPNGLGKDITIAEWGWGHHEFSFPMQLRITALRTQEPNASASST